MSSDSGAAVYTAAPPDRRPGGQADTIGPPLRLALVEHQVFDAAGPFGDEDRIYFTDLMASYGLDVPTERFAGVRTSFRDMITAMVPRLRPFGDRYDLALLTWATPDCQPGFPLAYLTHATSDPGLSFAVSDQGVVGPFTALRIIENTVRMRGLRRALLFVLDQSTLLHDEPVPARLRAAHDAAVVLGFDPGGTLATISPPTVVEVAAREASQRSVDELARVLAGRAATTVIYGAAVPDAVRRVPAEELLAAPAGAPATGLWATLARELPRWRRTGRTVVLVDYDEEVGRLAHCLIVVAAEDSREP